MKILLISLFVFFSCCESVNQKNKIQLITKKKNNLEITRHIELKNLTTKEIEPLKPFIGDSLPRGVWCEYIDFDELQLTIKETELSRLPKDFGIDDDLLLKGGQCLHYISDRVTRLNVGPLKILVPKWWNFIVLRLNKTKMFALEMTPEHEMLSAKYYVRIAYRNTVSKSFTNMQSYKKNKNAVFAPFNVDTFKGKSVRYEYHGQDWFTFHGLGKNNSGLRISISAPKGELNKMLQALKLIIPHYNISLEETCEGCESVEQNRFPLITKKIKSLKNDLETTRYIEFKYLTTEEMELLKPFISDNTFKILSHIKEMKTVEIKYKKVSAKCPNLKKFEAVERIALEEYNMLRVKCPDLREVIVTLEAALSKFVSIVKPYKNFVVYETFIASNPVYKQILEKHLATLAKYPEIKRARKEYETANTKLTKILAEYQKIRTESPEVKKARAEYDKVVAKYPEVKKARVKYENVRYKNLKFREAEIAVGKAATAYSKALVEYEKAFSKYPGVKKALIKQIVKSKDID